MAVELTFGLVTMGWLVKQPPIYRATVDIEIDPESRDSNSQTDNAHVTEDAQRAQLSLLVTRPLVQRVIQDLHLEDTTDTYLEHLQVSPGGSMRLIKLSFDSKDPQLAARVANAHVQHFIEQNLSNKWKDTQQASGFLNQQLANLKANLEKSEDRLEDYARENQIMFTEDGRSSATARLNQLEQEFAKAQAEVIQKESYERLARLENVDALPQVNTPLVDTLRGKLSELKREDSILGSTETPEHPERKRVLSQISEIEKAMQNEKAGILKQIRADYTAAKVREDSLAAALNAQRKLANDTDQKLIQYKILKREADSNKAVYEGMLNRLTDAGVSATFRASNIHVVEPAEVPISPVRPRRLAITLFSLIGGLVVGLAGAVLSEFV